MNQDKRTSRVIISVRLLGVFLLLFAGRLVQLQLVHGAEYAEQGKSISSASTRVEAARGEILDRNGNPLVTNRQGNSITFNVAQKFPADNKDEIAQRNQLVNSLIELLESKGEKWIDNLPLIYDESGKIAFPENRESDVAYLKSDEILHVVYATAQNCLDALIEKHSPGIYAGTGAQKLASVYYEMHRLMFSKRTPYTFAEDVSTLTVAEIKEKAIYQGVEIEVVPYREYVDGALAPISSVWSAQSVKMNMKNIKRKVIPKPIPSAKTASKRQWKNTCAAQTA